MTAAFGRPDARQCRWCQATKYLRNAALICRICDGPIHELKIKRGSS